MLPAGVVLLIVVAAIAFAVWLGYAIRQAIRRNERTRHERLHEMFHRNEPPSTLSPARSPYAPPPEPKSWYDRPPAPRVGPWKKPTEWWFDKERREREERERAANRPELDGDEIMVVLGIPPGPAVGRATRHLLAYRREHGDQGKEAATAELRRWWRAQRK